MFQLPAGLLLLGLRFQKPKEMEVMYTILMAESHVGLIQIMLGDILSVGVPSGNLVDGRPL